MHLWNCEWIFLFASLPNLFLICILLIAVSLGKGSSRGDTKKGGICCFLLILSTLFSPIPNKKPPISCPYHHPIPTKPHLSLIPCTHLLGLVCVRCLLMYSPCASSWYSLIILCKSLSLNFTNVIGELWLYNETIPCNYTCRMQYIAKMHMYWVICNKWLFSSLLIFFQCLFSAMTLAFASQLWATISSDDSS